MIFMTGERVVIAESASMIGTWRSFGPAGPVYEIIGAGKALPGGERMMRIRVVETGEELDYRFTEMLDDPEER